jgi:hypothetical protein
MARNYRLLTRGDIDGLACAALLTEAGIIDSVVFTHADDLLSGRLAVTAQDILTDLPYVPGCHLAFDHHGAEIERAPVVTNLVLDAASPSSSRLVFNHLGGPWVVPSRLDPLLAAADRAAVAGWTPADILEPAGWALLSLLLDPRTGVERRAGCSPEETALFLASLIDPLRLEGLEHVLALPDVARRAALYHRDAPAFEELLGATARMEGQAVLIDLRHSAHVPAGNRFLAYALFPAAVYSLRLSQTPDGRIMIACGRSIFDRRSGLDIGRRMVKLGGTGHARSGSCLVAPEKADAVVTELLGWLNSAP